MNLDSHSDLKRRSRPESSGHEIVHQNEEKSRDEHCRAADTPASPLGVPILDSPWVVGTGRAAVLGGIICILVCVNDDPVSPFKPQ